MSRSNPHDNGASNPAVRWFEWNGEHGTIRYYDKDAKKNVDVALPFTFLLLDQLGSVRGWHDASESGIYSNEVKDTRQEVLIVKSFKGGTLAEGRYKDIKDRVNAVGGQFVANCYIAFKHTGDLAIGSLRFKGAALRAWMDFCKAHRADLYKKAITIYAFTEGKKGRITFRVPQLKVTDVSAETDARAVELDRAFQEWVAGYFKRTTREQIEAPAHVSGEDAAPDYDHEPPLDDRAFGAPITDDDIPF